jgi:formamidopyrimidine-DNA glycosylase
VIKNLAYYNTRTRLKAGFICADSKPIENRKYVLKGFKKLKNEILCEKVRCYVINIMPEGPEVYVTCTDLSKLLVGERIETINIVGGRYEGHGPPVGWDLFIRELPLKVTGVYCKGKMMWFEFDDCEYVLISRFGMSGYYGVRDQSEKSPKHTAIEFSIVGEDYVVYYNDVRRFGTFKISKNIDEELDCLGPCFTGNSPKDDLIDKETFVKIIKKQRGPLAKRLMDQKIVSGIGNYILSECLHRSNLNPLITCEELTVKDIECLYNSVVSIVNCSIKQKGVTLRDYRPLTQEGKECGESENDGHRFLKVYKKNHTDKDEKVYVIPKGPHGRAIYYTESQLE